MTTGKEQTMNTEQIVSLIVAVLTGLATAIPLVIKLVQYVQKATQEKNWGNLLGLLIELMEQAEQMFDTGATRKEWVMAMAQTSAEYIAYPLDTAALSDLIDEMIKMTKKVNAPLTVETVTETVLPPEATQATVVPDETVTA